MKVVINTCFGGFSLSNLATQEYYQKKGKTVFWYKRIADYGSKVPPKYIPATIDDDHWDVSAFSSENPTDDSWDTEYLTNRPDDRADLDLVEVVDRLGDKANGLHAQLKVVEIPDGIDWEIDEYDGWETVEEKHRSWS